MTNTSPVSARRARFQSAPQVSQDNQSTKDMLLDIVCLKVELQGYYSKGLAA